MPLEIERKFLVTSNAWLAGSVLVGPLRQGYIKTASNTVVRVRTRYDEKAWITLKGQALDETPIARPEYEYPIPTADALEMLNTLCDGGIVEKDRYEVRHGNLTWEVDVFKGANAGLLMVEAELPATDTEIVRPSWVGREVSTEAAYFNVNLARHPYAHWTDEEKNR